ncbi:MAG: hypothetical protein EPN21_15720 [Methylococcaceae bacterium]|nr:MAG: hypothetical protein EPN21_15720 [Methylococcaceae bacterium]
MLELRKFSYYFNVKGNEGGLFSITLEMAPTIPPEADEATCKSLVRDAFNRLVQNIEALLAKTQVTVSAKTPTFTDSPAGLEAGFEYQTTGIKVISLRFLHGLYAMMRRRLAAPITLGNNYGKGRIEIAFRVSKHQSEAVIELKISAGHDLNLESLQFIRAFPDLTISPGAARYLHDLDLTLEKYAEGGVNRLIQS